jgi:iron complex outermembrane recepter protein
LTLSGNYDRFEFILGAYYFHEKNGVRIGAIFGSDAPQYFGAPQGAVIDLSYSGNIHNAAVYGDLTYSFSDKLKLNLGLRVNHEYNKFVQCSEVPGVPLTEFRLGSKSTRVSPNVALRYEFSPDVNGYAQFTRGYKSGGSNLGAAGGPNRFVSFM